MNGITLKIAGMTCGGCANSVHKALQRIAPAARVDVDLENGLARIDGEVSADAAVAAVVAAGFEAAPLKAC